jgi:hypothetical protein
LRDEAELFKVQRLDAVLKKYRMEIADLDLLEDFEYPDALEE